MASIGQTDGSLNDILVTDDIENVDILDGTPLLDIKPYVPEFDHQQAVRLGWLEKVKGKAREKKSDDRFK